MATHNIVFEKIEFSYGSVPAPEFWVNEDEVTEGCLVDGDGYEDITLQYSPPGGSTTVWVPGTGWTDPATSFPSDPSDLTINLDGPSVSDAPEKIRITIAVTGALDLLLDYTGIIALSQEDSYDGILVTPVGGGATNYDLRWTVSTTGTVADIQTYVFEYDVVENPDRGFVVDMDRFEYFADIGD